MKYLYGITLLLSACMDSKEDCVTGQDSDSDGLNDCLEIDIGTDINLKDSDGDGLTDSEEVDCVSNPLNGDEVCYACGWEHNDPDNLASTGSDKGDVIDNLLMYDQCGDAVNLWDFHGKYNILYLTVGWCNTCNREAGDLQTIQEEFIAETGLDFEFLLVLYESPSGYPAVPEDSISYADRIGNPNFPVFADGEKIVVNATPLTNYSRPEMCILSPEMEIVECYSGYDGYENALEGLKIHAGL